MLLTHRKLLQSKAIAIENDLRATLRNFGLKVGMVGTVKFEARIKELVENLPDLAALVEPLLIVRRLVREQLGILHRRLLAIVRDDDVCRRLMTVPGVGPVVALTYRVTVDVPARFRNSMAVGANLFLHYAFDMWMARTCPHIPFERYADDAICHCKSAEEAQALWSALADRFAACKLVLHPQKTKIVYCKDANRRGDFPSQSFDFLGFMFRARKTMWRGRPAHGFMPAASPKALTSISRTIRRWTLHHHSDKSLQDLAETYNTYIQGWINYYGNFYRTQLRPTLKRIDLYVIRWARRKFKRLRRKTKGARDWFDRLRRANPTLFAHWQLCHGNGRTSGAV